MSDNHQRRPDRSHPSEHSEENRDVSLSYNRSHPSEHPEENRDVSLYAAPVHVGDAMYSRDAGSDCRNPERAQLSNRPPTVSPSGEHFDDTFSRHASAAVADLPVASGASAAVQFQWIDESPAAADLQGPPRQRVLAAPSPSQRKPEAPTRSSADAAAQPRQLQPAVRRLLPAVMKGQGPDLGPVAFDLGTDGLNFTATVASRAADFANKTSGRSGLPPVAAAAAMAFASFGVSSRGGPSSASAGPSASGAGLVSCGVGLSTAVSAATVSRDSSGGPLAGDLPLAASFSGKQVVGAPARPVNASVSVAAGSRLANTIRSSLEDWDAQHRAQMVQELDFEHGHDTHPAVLLHNHLVTEVDGSRAHFWEIETTEMIPILARDGLHLQTFTQADLDAENASQDGKGAQMQPPVRLGGDSRHYRLDMGVPRALRSLGADYSGNGTDGITGRQLVNQTPDSPIDGDVNTWVSEAARNEIDFEPTPQSPVQEDVPDMNAAAANSQSVAIMPDPEGIIIRDIPNRLLFAISGPTSSGKTTLSYLLHEVFANKYAAPSSGFASTIVHQDAFFLPSNRPGAPVATWVDYRLEERNPDGSTTTTNMHIGNSIAADDKLDNDGYMKILRAFRNQCIKDNVPVVTTTPDPTHPQIPSPDKPRVHPAPPVPQTERFGLHNIRATRRYGENRDCRSALDWNAFSYTLVKAKLSLPDSDFPDASTDGDPNPPKSILDAATPAKDRSLIAAETAQALSLIPAGLIAKLRARVHSWVAAAATANDECLFPGRAVINNQLRGVAFVEGFLLLVDPSKNSGINCALVGAFDAKLFLPATRDGARARRFARPEYSDAVRRSWMTWREESYFDGVAWPRFVAEHAWLFAGAVDDESALELGLGAKLSMLADAYGVVPRPSTEAGVEETLVWAVESLLSTLHAREVAARRTWVEFCAAQPFDLGQFNLELLDLEQFNPQQLDSQQSEPSQSEPQEAPPEPPTPAAQEPESRTQLKPEPEDPTAAHPSNLTPHRANLPVQFAPQQSAPSQSQPQSAAPVPPTSTAQEPLAAHPHRENPWYTAHIWVQVLLATAQPRPREPDAQQPRRGPPLSPASLARLFGSGRAHSAATELFDAMERARRLAEKDDEERAGL